MNRIHIGSLDLYGCKDAHARLEPYIDGELPHNERRSVSFHLVICRRCALLFRFEERLDHTVRRGLNEAPIPTEVHTKIQQVLQRAREGDISPSN